MKKPIREHDVQSQIKDYLVSIGAYVLRVNSGQCAVPGGGFVKFGKKGTPDLITCVRGRFCALEIKKDQKEINKWMKKKEVFNTREYWQESALNKIDKSGGLACIVCSVDQVKFILQSEKLI